MLSILGIDIAKYSHRQFRIQTLKIPTNMIPVTQAIVNAIGIRDRNSAVTDSHDIAHITAQTLWNLLFGFVDIVEGIIHLKLIRRQLLLL